MKGLILKDLINLKKFLTTCIVFIFIYGVMAIAQEDASMFSSIISMVFAAMTFSTFSFDEMAKWDSYALTMPLTRDNIVMGKYFTLLTLTLISTVIGLVIVPILNLYLKVENVFFGINACALGAVIIILFYCITLPIIFKLGIEKARLIFAMIILLPFVAGYMIFKAINNGSLVFTDTQLRIWEVVTKNVYIIIPLVIILALGISYSISIKIYRRKEF